MPQAHTHKIRVIFGDTDQLGVVYYANYLRYFEAARASYLRALGKSNRVLEAWGVALPVAECQCRYIRPARYEDELCINLSVGRLGGASIRFDYKIQREETLIATGHTLHASVNPKTLKPTRLSNDFRALIERDMRT